jgi:hypothetical protein
MVEIFSDLGELLDSAIEWLIEHTVCKLRGHRVKHLMGSYPFEVYCDRCHRMHRRATEKEIRDYQKEVYG